MVEVLFVFLLETVGAGRPLIGFTAELEVGAGRPLIGLTSADLDVSYTTLVEVRVTVFLFFVVVDDGVAEKVTLTVVVIVRACTETVSSRRGRYAAAAYWPASRAQVRMF